MCDSGDWGRRGAHSHLCGRLGTSYSLEDYVDSCSMVSSAFPSIYGRRKEKQRCGAWLFHVFSVYSSFMLKWCSWLGRMQTMSALTYIYLDRRRIIKIPRVRTSMDDFFFLSNFLQLDYRTPHFPSFFLGIYKFYITYLPHILNRYISVFPPLVSSFCRLCYRNSHRATSLYIFYLHFFGYPSIGA